MDKVVEMVFGSHLYGLNTPSSDKDYKGVVLPTKEQILLQQAKFSLKQSTGNDKQKNTSDDVDIEFASLHNFIDHACQGETFAIDMLHAPKSTIIHSSDIWEYLQENRHKFYTKGMKAYVGYVRKQAAKYGVKGSRLAVLEEALTVAKVVDNGMGGRLVGLLEDRLPVGEYSQWVETEHPQVGKQIFYEICGRKFQSTLKLPMFIDQLQHVYDSYGERAKLAQSNEGVDFKAVSHALRAGYQAKWIYLEGGFEYPLKETDFLMQVKKGELDYTTVVQPELERLVDEVMLLADASSYPEKVDRKFWDKFVSEIHESIVLGG